MLLSGRELASTIKERQARVIRALAVSGKVPSLAIVQCGEAAVSNKYIAIKQKYAADVGAQVLLHQPSTSELPAVIHELNQNLAVQGIIVQLPLPEGANIEPTLNSIAPLKDIDALGQANLYDPPTPTAILWLLEYYDIKLVDKAIAIIGRGRLVGAPLTRILRQRGIEPLVCDEATADLKNAMQAAGVIITATGQPNLITADLIKPGQIIIDAGTADVNGSLVGDASPVLYARKDIKISPVRGGIGPLTVCALFENLVEAFKRQAFA